jgi:hypothetical protein
MSETTFRSGCVYWPRRKGPFFLAAGFGVSEGGSFDPGEVRDELSHLAEVGFNYIRVALPWEAVQPDERRLRTPLLDRLVAVLEAAQAAGLDVQLVLLGQLGGSLFVPDWLLATTPETVGRPTQARLISNGWETTWPLGDLYEDSGLLRNQRYLWEEIATNLAAHPALAELDLGAGGLLTVAPPARRDAPFAWWEAVAEAATASDPALPLLYSDGITLLMQAGLPPLNEWQQAAGRIGIAANQPETDDDGRADEEWPRFLMVLARTLARAPVGCASLGLPTRAGSSEIAAVRGDAQPLRVRYTEEEQARFFSEVLPALHADGVPFVCHAAWANAPTELLSHPPYDRNVALRHCGLLRADGTEKEAVRALQRFHEQTGTTPQGDGRALEMDEEEWYRRRSEAGYVAELYQRFRNGEI